MTTTWCPVIHAHDADPCAACGWSPVPEETHPDIIERVMAAFGWCAPSTVEYEVES